MDNQEPQIKVQEILKKIDELEKELIEIRKSCPHEYYKIDFNKDTSFTSLVKICKNCSEEIGYPTEQEIKITGFI